MGKIITSMVNSKKIVYIVRYSELIAHYFAMKGRINLKDFKILLVEDERQMSMFIKMELNHEEYMVDVAYDGREGLDLSEKIEYDLILLDIMIPKLNGIEVCRRIRKFSKVPIIMLTAKDDVSDKVLGLDIGDTNVVDMFIRYLRIKIDDGFEDKLINTVRGVGYVIEGD